MDLYWGMTHKGNAQLIDSFICAAQAPFTVAQMRKFADKLRNFSMTPSPDSQQASGGPRRRHSMLSASAVQTPLTHSSMAAESSTPHSSWVAPLQSPAFAPADSPAFGPQRLLSQFGASPQVASTAKKGNAGRDRHLQAAGQGLCFNTCSFT